MKIGEASRRTGLTARAIRLYEASGIIGAPQRGIGGYRRFTEQDVRMLALVQRARRLGFALESIRQLVGFLRTGPQTSSDVARILESRIAQTRRCEADLRARREVLESALTGPAHDQAGCRLLALLLGDDASGDAGEPLSGGSAQGAPTRGTRRSARPAGSER